MNRCSMLPTLVSLLIAIAILGAWCAEAPNVIIEAFPTLNAPGFPIHGPMNVAVHIKNRSADTIELLWNYPIVHGFDATIIGVAGEARDISHPGLTSVSVAPISIKANSEYIISVFLTNYFSFSSIGSAHVSWRAEVPIRIGSNIQSVAGSGGFIVPIVMDDPKSLAVDLMRMVQLSRIAVDPGVRDENVAELCSVRDPAVIPFLRQLFAPSKYERVALMALCDDWLGNAEARTILDDYLLKGTDDYNMVYVLSRFIASDHMLSDKLLAHLLSSADLGQRYCGVWYMKAVLARLPIDALPPLAATDKDNPNGKQIQEIFDGMSNLLDKTGRKWGDRADPKKNGDGF
jgi:hypothetical protein